MRRSTKRESTTRGDVGKAKHSPARAPRGGVDRQSDRTDPEGLTNQEDERETRWPSRERGGGREREGEREQRGVVVAEGTFGAAAPLSVLDPHPIFYPVTNSCLGGAGRTPPPPRSLADTQLLQTAAGQAKSVRCTCGPISSYSGRDCVKSLRSSYTGKIPQTEGAPSVGPAACL